MPTSPQPLSATHIAFDLDLAERLRAAGLPHVLRVSDRLTFGPSREDPSEHVRAREGFFGEPVTEWNDLYSPSVRCVPPIVLWISADPVERMNLWLTCHFLDRQGIAAESVFSIEQASFPSSGSDAWYLEVASSGQPFSALRLSTTADLWRSFAAPDPKRFVDRATRPVAGFPELSPLWRVLSAFFPRRSADGLMLSRFDALVLRALANEPRSPLKVFTHDLEDESDWRAIMTATGDIFLADHLRRWASHGSSPAVVAAPGSRPHNPMLAATYEITERGRRLLDEGLRGLDEAPPFPFGGVTAYSTESPWVLVSGGDIERITETHR